MAERHDKVKGVFYCPVGDGPFPFVWTSRSADMGEVTLLSYEQLREAGIGSKWDKRMFEETLVQAKWDLFCFMAVDPFKVDPDRLGVLGISRGVSNASDIVFQSEDDDYSVQALAIVAPGPFSLTEEAMIFRNISRFRGKLLVIGARGDEYSSQSTLGQYLDCAKLAESRELKIIDGKRSDLYYPDSFYRETSLGAQVREITTAFFINCLAAGLSQEEAA